MNCAESEILMHALIDGELDAGHARDVEAHIAACSSCTAKLAAFRSMRAAMTQADLKETVPARLRQRIEAALPASPAAAASPIGGAPRIVWPTAGRTSRRGFFGGFALGAALSAAAAASLVFVVARDDQDQRIAGEIVSAHLRSLQAGHLTDVETSDQHTVKPWFNGKVDVAPPVIDLTAQGFTLIGGRLDYINGEPVAAIVYRRRKHVINLFVERHVGGTPSGPRIEVKQGFNVRHWSQDGLDFWAVSDINATELDEFGQTFNAALQPTSAPS